MAEYIDDSGTHVFDALLSGTKGGAGTTDYDYSTTNKVLTFNSEATAETNFTLPTSTPWLLIETYDIEDVDGAVSYTKYQKDVSNVSVATTGDIQIAWGIVDANANISLFSMVATHYKGDGTADIYETDESADFSTTPTLSNTTFTVPTGTWQITDTTVSDVGRLYDIILTLDTINTDGSGLRTLDNTGTTGTSDDAELHGSNLIYLDGTTQYVQIPLEHTLGSEISSLPMGYTNMTRVGDVYTADADSGYTNDVINASNFTTDRAIIQYQVTPTAISTAGQLIMNLYRQSPFGGASPAIYPVANETSTRVYSYTKTEGLTAYYPRLTISTSGESFTLPDANFSAKEVTLTTAAVIYFDQATKEYVSITEFFNEATTDGNTEVSCKIEASFSHACTLAVEPTAGDLTFLTANPEALVDMWDGTSYAGDLSFDVDDIQGLYIGSEGELLNAGNEFIPDIETVGTDYFSGYEQTRFTPDGAGSVVDDGGGDVTLNVTTGTAVRPWVTWNYTTDVVKDEMFLISCDVIKNSGADIILKNFYLASGTNAISINYTLTTTLTKVYAIGKALEDETATDGFGMNFDTSAGASNFSISNITIDKINATEIVNYATACRTTYENVDYGPTNFKYNQDASGRVTSMVTIGELSGASDGRKIVLPLTTPADYLVTECIKHIEGTASSLTITDCDDDEHIIDTA